jgi:glucose-1-phosphate adenylyltransferase
VIPTKVLTMVLAGGKGERLFPLTAHRSKPSVPFGGNYKIIDFTLMNCVMSGIRSMYVLTQYHSQSLNSHIRERWDFLSSEMGEFIDILPPKLRNPTAYYKGTADSIFCNLDILEENRPDVVLILSGDHVYRADYAAMIRSHVESGADVTVLCGEVETEEAKSFGVVETGPDGAINNFVEKPDNPEPYAEDDICKINLGVYCFNTKFLVQRLVADAKRNTAHDFGKNILPESVRIGSVQPCSFPEISPDGAYWRDVGSIDSYFQCHQDLLGENPKFDLLDPRWPAGSRLRDRVPVKVSQRGNVEPGWSLISGGVQIDRSRIVRSVIAPRVEIKQGATVDHCVLFEGVTIGAGSRIRNAIIDEGVTVPDGAVIGYGNDLGRFSISPGGVIVIDRGYQFHTQNDKPISVRVSTRSDDSGTSSNSDERFPLAVLQK